MNAAFDCLCAVSNIGVQLFRWPPLPTAAGSAGRGGDRRGRAGQGRAWAVRAPRPWREAVTAAVVVVVAVVAMVFAETSLLYRPGLT
jgi:hypothetical protein